MVADLPPELGMLDTAAEWCVLPLNLGKSLGYPVAAAGLPMLLSTRLGTFRGTLERIPIRYLATVGEDLAVVATWFVSEDWPGPLVIGWSGCLERLRFALDPSDETFYFGEL
jgi:hypothetical protein